MSAGPGPSPGRGRRAHREPLADGIWAVGTGRLSSSSAHAQGHVPYMGSAPTSHVAPGGTHTHTRHLDLGSGCRSRNPRLVLPVIAALAPSIPQWAARAGVPSLCVKGHIKWPRGLGLSLAICPEGTGHCL